MSGAALHRIVARAHRPSARAGAPAMGWMDAAPAAAEPGPVARPAPDLASDPGRGGSLAARKPAAPVVPALPLAPVAAVSGLAATAPIGVSAPAPAPGVAPAAPDVGATTAAPPEIPAPGTADDGPGFRPGTPPGAPAPAQPPPAAARSAQRLAGDTRWSALAERQAPAPVAAGADATPLPGLPAPPTAVADPSPAGVEPPVLLAEPPGQRTVPTTSPVGAPRPPGPIAPPAAGATGSAAPPPTVVIDRIEIVTPPARPARADPLASLQSARTGADHHDWGAT